MGIDQDGTMVLTIPAMVKTSGRGDAIRQRFTGKERDGETGLACFGARYLSGAMGRFTSAYAPWADRHVGDPSSWNLYLYVQNNPLTYVAPFLLSRPN